MFVRVHIYRENCWKRLWLLNSIIYSLLLDAQNWNSSKWKPRKPKSSNLLIARTKTSHCERKLLRKGQSSCCLIASFIYLNCCFSHFNRNSLCEIEVFSFQIARWVSTSKSQIDSKTLSLIVKFVRDRYAGMNVQFK